MSLRNDQTNARSIEKIKINLSLKIITDEELFNLSVDVKDAELNMQGSILDHKCICMLNTMLLLPDCLSSLDLSHREMKDEELANLSAGLYRNTSLTALYLNNNMLGDDGISRMMSILRANPGLKLKTLDLCTNQIAKEGCSATASMLSRNNTLTHLYMGHNNFGDDGIVCLMNAINANPELKLESLDLNCSGIHEKGYKAIADMITSQGTITEINLTGNCPREGKELIKEIEYQLALNKRPEIASQKQLKIKLERQYLQNLKDLLESDSFIKETQYRTGAHEFLARIKDNSITILKKWDALIRIVDDRRRPARLNFGPFERLKPTIVGGRPQVIIDLYDYVSNAGQVKDSASEEDRLQKEKIRKEYMDKIEEMRNTYLKMDNQICIKQQLRH